MRLTFGFCTTHWLILRCFLFTFKNPSLIVGESIDDRNTFRQADTILPTQLSMLSSLGYHEQAIRSGTHHTSKHDLPFVLDEGTDITV